MIPVICCDLISVRCFSCRHALPFEAYFAPSSDLEFTVTPASGELSPVGTEGTLIRVAYKPQIYGKTHKARLMVQVRNLTRTCTISRFHLNSHTLGFHQQTQKLEPPCTA